MKIHKQKTEAEIEKEKKESVLTIGRVEELCVHIQDLSVFVFRAKNKIHTH